MKTFFALVVIFLCPYQPLLSCQNRIDLQGAGEMAHYAAQNIVPIPLVVSAQPATIVDMELCGSNGDSGSFLSVIVPGATANSLVLDKLSCNMSSLQLAKQLWQALPKAQWIAVASIGASWSNFAVILQVQQAIVYRSDLSIDPVTAAQIVALGQVLAVPTSSFSVATNGQSITFAARVWFSASAMSVSFFPTAFQSQLPQASAPIFDSQADGANDTVVKMSYADADYFNGLLSPGGFNVSTVAGVVHIGNLQISGATDTLSTVGRLSSPGSPDFTATVQAQGDDLTISSVQLAPGFNCDGTTGVARVQCEARLNLAKAAGNLIAQRLNSMYDGFLVRPTGQSSQNPIKLGSNSYLLNSMVNKCHASSDGIYLLGTLSLEKK